MSFSQSQIDIANTILSVGRSLGATEKQIRAAFTAAKVESNFANLNYGDRDSLGVFQQRPSQGWGTPTQILDVGYAARKFFETAMKVSQSGTVGQLAQRVQRSAFPGRYDDVLSVTDDLYYRLAGGVANAVANFSPAISAVSAPNNNQWLIYGAIGLLALFYVRS